MSVLAEIFRWILDVPSLAARDAPAQEPHERDPAVYLELLRQVSDPCVPPHLYASPIRLELPGDEPQQRGLPGAVAADEADPVGVGDSEAEPAEEALVPELKGDVFEGENRHESAPATGSYTVG